MKPLNRQESLRPSRGSGARLPDRMNQAITHASYRYSTIEVRDAIRLAGEGSWDVPDFQRSFVWKPQQICELADSLWHGYPTGSLLLWQRTEGRARNGRPVAWIADGQQRVTSMCVMAAAPASWMTRRGNSSTLAEIEILFDALAISPPRFVPVVIGKRRTPMPSLVPLRELMALDLSDPLAGDRLVSIACNIHQRDASCASHVRATLARLTRAAAISRRELMVTNLDCANTGDVLEIFRRLNSRGMRFRRLLLKLATSRIHSFQS